MRARRAAAGCAGAPNKGRQPPVSCFQLKKPDLSIGKLGGLVLAPAGGTGQKLIGCDLFSIEWMNRRLRGSAEHQREF